MADNNYVIPQMGWKQNKNKKLVCEFSLAFAGFACKSPLAVAGALFLAVYNFEKEPWDFINERISLHPKRVKQ